MDQEGASPGRLVRGDLNEPIPVDPLRDLQRGRGNCWLISGAPCSGKTLTLARFLATADSQAMKTLLMRCRPASTGFGASVWPAVLRWAQGNSHNARRWMG